MEGLADCSILVLLDVPVRSWCQRFGTTPLARPTSNWIDCPFDWNCRTFHSVLMVSQWRGRSCDLTAQKRALGVNECNRLVSTGDFNRRRFPKEHGGTSATDSGAECGSRFPRRELSQVKACDAGTEDAAGTP